MKNPDILVFDTEHGGFVENASLLEVYFAVADADSYKIKDELHLFLKPDDGAYVLTAEAMGVNKIDIVEHDKKAIKYKDGGTLLRGFLERNTNNGKKRLDPLGHNVHGDVQIVVKNLLNNRNAVWTHYVSYRQLDTGSISQHYIRKGYLPPIKASLNSLITHFKVNIPNDHTAKNDALATLAVYRELEDWNGLCYVEESK